MIFLSCLLCFLHVQSVKLCSTSLCEFIVLNCTFLSCPRQSLILLTMLLLFFVCVCVCRCRITVVRDALLFSSSSKRPNMKNADVAEFAPSSTERYNRCVDASNRNFNRFVPNCLGTFFFLEKKKPSTCFARFM